MTILFHFFCSTPAILRPDKVTETAMEDLAGERGNDRLLPLADPIPKDDEGTARNGGMTDAMTGETTSRLEMTGEMIGEMTGGMTKETKEEANGEGVDGILAAKASLDAGE